MYVQMELCTRTLDDYLRQRNKGFFFFYQIFDLNKKFLMNDGSLSAVCGFSKFKGKSSMNFFSFFALEAGGA